MAKDRRALIEGLNTDDEIDLEAAEQFITGRKPRPPAKAAAPLPTKAEISTPPAPEPITVQKEPASPAPPPPLPTSLIPSNPPATSPLTGVGRVPVGARVRTELAAMLKRASLERQLQGIQPNSVQEILEDAIELWLHKHGLLK